MSNVTTRGLLYDLVMNRDKLIANLSARGQTTHEGEKFNSLVPKVLDIISAGGVEYGEWIPTENTSTFTLSNIPFEPSKIGIACEEVYNDKIVGENMIFIALVTLDNTEENTGLFVKNGTTLESEPVPTTALWSTTDNGDGTYSVTLSFVELNELDPIGHFFKGDQEYVWIVHDERWFF